MKAIALLGRILLGGGALVLAYAMSKGLLDLWQQNPWAEMSPMAAFIGRSQTISLIAIPLGAFLTAVWPRLWPIPVAALIWTLVVTVLIEPEEFDFIFNWLLRRA